MIFLSYRRADDVGYVGRLADCVAREFGNDQVFHDIDDLAPGRYWKEQLDQQLSNTDVVLAVMGKQWTAELVRRAEVTAQDDHAEEDILVFELNTARSMGIPVMPILLPGVQLPDRQSLGSLDWLLDVQSFTVSDGQARWDHDSKKLIAEIHSLSGLQRANTNTRWQVYRPWILSSIVVAVCALLVLVYFFIPFKPGDTTAKGGHANTLPMPLGELTHLWELTNGLSVFLDAVKGSDEERFLNNLKFPASTGQQGVLFSQFCQANVACIECDPSPPDSPIEHASLISVTWKPTASVIAEDMPTSDNSGTWQVGDNPMPWENIDPQTGRRKLYGCRPTS